MHAYLRSIGLTDDRITEKDIEKLCDRVYEKYDHMESVRDEDTKATFLEFSKELGKGFGLKVLGMQDSFGFHRTSYYPYVVSSGEGSDGSVGIQKKLMGDAFIGVCNDGHVGAPLIFTLQNRAGFFCRQETWNTVLWRLPPVGRRIGLRQSSVRKWATMRP